MKLFQRNDEIISGEIMGENSGSSSVARKRLINAINCERTHLDAEINEMLQQDIRRVIENYLGTDIEESDLILEIKAPDYGSFRIENV